MFIPPREKTWPIFTDAVFQPGLIFCTFALRMVPHPQSISTLLSAAAEIQQRQHFKVHPRLSSLGKGGGEGSAWHLLFTFQATVESSHGPSWEMCAHLIHPGVWILQLRILLTKCPYTHTRKPACRCNYQPDKVPDLRPTDSAELGPRRAVPVP